MADKEEIKDIIAETIHELHAEGTTLQFQKPKTMQGWFYVILAVGSILAFLWTSVVFLNDVAEHAKEPHHIGTIEIFEKLQEQHKHHATSEELHHREEHLELKIIEEVSPIKEKLGSIEQNQVNFRQDVRDIRQDVRDVQQSINNLSEDIRRNHQ